MIYATPFNQITKRAIGPSVPTGVETLAQARTLMPDTPVVETKNTLIYEQAGDSRLCLSWIKFEV